MPQLVKGGKYIFGWSYVHPDGFVKIPPEAFDEHQFKYGEKLIIMSGSKTSGGFAITNSRHLQKTPLSSLINRYPEILQFKKLEDGYISFGNRILSWTILNKKGYILISSELLKKFGIKPCEKLLAGRGSGLALAFIKKGTIIEEAKKHPGLDIFQ